MAKKKKNKGKKTRKPRISRRPSPSGPREGSIQGKIRQERDRMLSILNFDEPLRPLVEDMFNIDFEGLPAGKEPMFFSTALFQIDDAESAMEKIESLRDVATSGEDEDGARYVWSRGYPAGHWNPMSRISDARQVIGNIRVGFDNTLTLETNTKGWMTGLIHHVISALGKEMKLINLEFKNPLDRLK